MSKSYVNFRIKEHQAPFGQVLKLAIRKEQLIREIEENFHGEWVNLEILPRQEVSKYGETHSCRVDNYIKPENR